MGEDMLSFLYPRNRSAILLDTSYNVRHVVPVVEDGQGFDMHEFHIVDSGTRALVFYDQDIHVTRERSRAIGFMRGNCTVRNNLFRELNVENGFEQLYSWSGEEQIGLYESSEVEKTLYERCTQVSRPEYIEINVKTDEGQYWDYLHVNSLDKFPDGSYLMSSRHTDTIYKIGRTGDIIWRFGGYTSDFQASFRFMRQHNARIISSNESHTILSFFDNATKAPMTEATAIHSRGMIVELDTMARPMTARLLQDFPHPDGPNKFADGRANVQVLPNGNVWICWVDRLLSTEHTPDGLLILRAQVKQEYVLLLNEDQRLIS